jgi:hypothetical protein
MPYTSRTRSTCFAIAAYVGTLRAGEKPIDADAVRTAAQRLEWGHPDAPPVPPEFGAGAKLFADRCAQCHRAGGGTVPLALQTSIHAPVPDSVIEVHPQRHQPADRRARPLHAGLRLASVERGYCRAGEIPARSLQQAAAVEGVGPRFLHANLDPSC